MTTKAEFNDLEDSLQICNKACECISKIAFKRGIFNQFRLHQLVYNKIRNKFNLPSQLTINCIKKVSEAYRVTARRKTRAVFSSRGAIDLDARCFGINIANKVASISTINGRLKKIAFSCGKHNLNRLAFKQQHAKLIQKKDGFYLLVTCNPPEDTEITPTGVIGVDRGIVNIAATSNGIIYSGKQISKIRERQKKLRSKLASKKTRKSLILMKRIGSRESRFVKDVNHCISKEIVRQAKRTNCIIALEDLSPDINTKTRVRKPQRYERNSWSHAQLASFIEYKAKLSGVPIIYVDPAYTSQKCPLCGHTEKRNRKGVKFKCRSCGFAGHADLIGSINIANSGAAAVNLPYVNEISIMDKAKNYSMYLQAPGFIRG